MKTLLKMMVLLFAVLPLSIAIANEDISGTWQGNLAIDPDTNLTIQFIISKAPDGSYAVVLNTPDEGNVKDVAANEVVYDAGSLKVDVAELSGSYDGVVRDGKIEGEWKQEGTSFPLNLKPYEEPTLSKEDMAMLLGAWQGKPILPEGAMISINGETDITFLFQFKMSEQDEFTGSFTYAGMGMPEQPLTDMGISEGIFTFKIGEMQKFKGTITDKEIVGDLKFTGNANDPGMSLRLLKGEYKEPVYNLNLPEDIKAQLSGKWNGTLTIKAVQTISMAVEFRFETSNNGDFLGFVTMPEQGGSEMAVTNANMSDGNLVLAVKAMGGEFTGKLSADKIDGDWSMTGSESTSLTLKRGSYVAPVYTLSLPEETMNQLLGKWSGPLTMPTGDAITVVFRFERSENGEFFGFLDSPDQGGFDISITDAGFSDGKLTVKVANINGEFIGQLSDDQLIGDWKQMSNSTPLTLDKEKP